MNIWGAIKSSVNRAIAGVRNFYLTHWEAAEISTSRYQRGQWWRYGSVPDSREIQTPLSRMEIIRKAQDLERNNALARRLATIFVTYTVGAGLPIRPSSSDEEWNSARKPSWDLWCEMPDLTSVQDFDSWQCMVAWRTFFDGEGYIYKTRGNVPPYRPRVQFIEAAQIQTPPEMADRADIFDGIKTDPRGRRISYFVRQCINGKETYKEIDAKDIYPICDFDRPGDLHSFSYLAAVLNDIHDLDELCKLAMDKAKEAAEIKNVFTTGDGELPNAEAVRRAKFSTTETTSAGTEYTVERMQEFERKLGGKNIALREGESVKQLGSEAPNEIDREHWKLIAARVCAGTNIPILMVFPESIQGTVGRGIYADAAIYFASQSKLFQRAFKDIYRFVTREDMAIDRTISDVPAGFDWWKCSVRPPRSPDVDTGRNASATLAMLDAAATTYDEIYSPQGLDPEEQLWKAGHYAALIRKIATTLKVTPGEIRQAAGEAIKIAMEKETAAQTQADTEPIQQPVAA